MRCISLLIQPVYVFHTYIFAAIARFVDVEDFFLKTFNVNSRCFAVKNLHISVAKAQVGTTMRQAPGFAYSIQKESTSRGLKKNCPEN